MKILSNLSRNKKILFGTLGLIGIVGVIYTMKRKSVKTSDYTASSDNSSTTTPSSNNSTNINDSNNDPKPILFDYSNDSMSFPIVMGSKGDLVADLQRSLNSFLRAKHPTRKLLVVDGNYGKNTFGAHELLKPQNTLPLSVIGFEELKTTVYMLTR